MLVIAMANEEIDLYNEWLLKYIEKDMQQQQVQVIKPSKEKKESYSSGEYKDKFIKFKEDLKAFTKDFKAQDYKFIFKYLWKNGVRSFGNIDKYASSQQIDLTADNLGEQAEKLLTFFKAEGQGEIIDVASLEEKAHYEGKLYVESQLEKIRENLKSNREQYRAELTSLELVAKTDLEKMAVELNKIIILDKEMWELVLLSILSSYAPRVYITGIPHRNNLHTYLVGDISTAKSNIGYLIEQISPKAISYSKFTEASLEGIVSNQGIEGGIIDEAKDGVLLLNELEKFMRIDLLKEILDSRPIQINKGGQKKVIENPNITFIAFLNPRQDFFQQGVKREQIGIPEDIFSRIDIPIALVSSAEKNALLLPNVKLFDYTSTLNLGVIREQLYKLSIGMEIVKRVELNEEQLMSLTLAFKKHNRNMKNRPFLLFRDLEIVSRIANTIVALNFHSRRNEQGIFYAENSDIDKAIALWEYLLAIRSQLYNEVQSREIVSVKDTIFRKIIEADMITQPHLEKLIVDDMKLLSRATFYRYINELVEIGRISRVGLKNAELRAL